MTNCEFKDEIIKISKTFNEQTKYQLNTIRETFHTSRIEYSTAIGPASLLANLWNELHR